MDKFSVVGKEIIGGYVEWSEELQFNKKRMDQLIEDQCKLLLRKKETFVIDKFSEKGFESLTDGIEKRRFTGICKVEVDNWEYWYANDGSPNGKFIVATEMFHSDTPSASNGYEAMKITISFSWHETEPEFLKIYK